MRRYPIAVNGHEWEEVQRAGRLPAELADKIERTAARRMESNYRSRHGMAALAIIGGVYAIGASIMDRFVLAIPAAPVSLGGLAGALLAPSQALVTIRGEARWPIDLKEGIDEELAYYLNRIPSGNPLMIDFVHALGELRSYREMMKTVDRSLGSHRQRTDDPDQLRIALKELPEDAPYSAGRNLERRIVDAEELAMVHHEAQEAVIQISQSLEDLRALVREVDGQNQSVGEMQARIKSLIGGLEEMCGYSWQRAKELKSSQTT